MKKFNFNKKYLEISIYVLLVVFIILILNKIITNIESIGLNIANFFVLIKSVLYPFIFGFFIAYFVNPTARFVESLYKKNFQLRKRPKTLRLLSVVSTYILMLGTIIWIIAYLVPEVTSTTRSLLSTIQSNVSALQSSYETGGNMLDSFITGINNLFSTELESKTLIDDYVVKPLMSLVSDLPNLITKLFTGTINVASGFINVILGAVIGFYMLVDKEKFGAIIKKFILAYFKKPIANKIIHLASSSNIMFEKFFIGKAIDSSIIGIIFFIICLIIKAPYAILLSLIIGVTNMIPYFGPFIGAVPVVLIVLLNNFDNPLMAFWFIIIILILQQFDGIFLGPKIIGDSIGLQPIAVIFAIIVGGAFFGIGGMFFGAPAFAIILNMLNTIIDRRYDKTIQSED